MKKLFNADILKENPNNYVSFEHIKNIIPNNLCFVEHSIYFAETLKVFKDSFKQNLLIENLDYEFAAIDSIATEMSNKDCYRAIIFLTDIKEAYIEYHSYGDIISADMFNGMMMSVEDSSSKVNDLETAVSHTNKLLQEHKEDAAPHKANENAQKNSLALRTSNGTVKTAEPKENDDAVNLAHQNNAIDKAKNSFNETLHNYRVEVFTKIDSECLKKTNFVLNGTTLEINF